MVSRYDLAVIGAGPGGYVAAIRAGQLGLKTVVVEREPALGGVCLNWGCIPTKALLKNAEMVEFVQRRSGDFGIHVDDPTISWPEGVKRSRRVVKRMNKGIESLFKKQGVEWIRGSARFTDPNTLAIDGGHDGAPGEIEADHIIIATGSKARLLPGLTADGERVITSRDAVMLDEVPRHLIIMGAGAVGMEFAYIYRAYGSEVTVLEMLDQALPLDDEEAGAMVAKSFRRRGVDVRTGTRVEQVESTEHGVRVVTVCDGKEDAVTGDRVLVAIGRSPVTAGLELGSAGVELDSGYIGVTDGSRTSSGHIHAVGDVAGPPMLAHKASHQAVQAVNFVAGIESHPIDEWQVPSCTYCHPQVASVGRTEAQAREAGYEVKVSRVPFAAIGKAVAIGDHEGWIKIVADARYGEILGATIVGPDATELIHELVLARSAELTADDIAEAIHAHPTLSEAIHEAALGVEGLPIHV
jgi:dihydrolipoamide dehydrogenase